MREISPDNLRDICDTGAPVDLDKIVTFLGYEVKYAAIDSADAYLLGKIIVVKSTATLYRKRFSIAHEIGHIICGHDLRSISCTNIGNSLFSNTKVVLEREADTYASELLLPADELSKDIREDFSLALACQKAQAKYNVSLECYLLNFVKRADFPIAVMLREGSNIKWTVCSNSWDDQIEVSRYPDLSHKRKSFCGEWMDTYDSYDEFFVVHESKSFDQFGYEIVVFYTEI